MIGPKKLAAIRHRAEPLSRLQGTPDELKPSAGAATSIPGSPTLPQAHSV